MINTDQAQTIIEDFLVTFYLESKSLTSAFPYDHLDKKAYNSYYNYLTYVIQYGKLE